MLALKQRCPIPTPFPPNSSSSSFGFVLGGVHVICDLHTDDRSVTEGSSSKDISSFSRTGVRPISHSYTCGCCMSVSVSAGRTNKDDFSF
jgi:hypothetical protein